MIKKIKLYVLGFFLCGAAAFTVSSLRAEPVEAVTAQATCIKSCESVYRRCMVYAKSAQQKQSCETELTACKGRCQGKP